MQMGRDFDLIQNCDLCRRIEGEWHRETWEWKSTAEITRLVFELSESKTLKH